MRVGSICRIWRRRKARRAAFALLAPGLFLAAAASVAQAPDAPELCRKLPASEIAAALGTALRRASGLEDRLGELQRTVCNFHAETGDSVDVVLWTRRDRKPLPPAPSNAADCDLTCIQAGREPNLYAYAQRRFAGVTCVIRRPRADRDVNAGPLTACYGNVGARRLIVAVQRPPGTEPASFEKLRLAYRHAAEAR
jgi:hypothetical protein